MWPWGACWLQDEAWQTAGLDPHDGPLMLGCLLGRMKHGKPFNGFKGFKGLRAGRAGQTAGLDAHKKPLQTAMCGLGVPVGCRMKHGKR